MKQRVRVALKLVFLLLAPLLGLLLALTAGLWVWSGQPTSLDMALRQAGHFLPSGQSLVADGVQGSLRTGGHIERLEWQDGARSLQLQNVTLDWSLPELLQGERQAARLRLGVLRFQDRSTQSAATPTPVPEHFSLPWPLTQVSLDFAVDLLEWVGATTLRAESLTGNYIFDSKQHSLHGGKLRIASGDYQFQGSLQAQGPMALAVTLDGTVQTQIPSRVKPLTVTARATLSGDLAGRDASLALRAELLPQAAGQVTGKASPMQATVQAHIAPWQPQPLTDAQASWQGLDLAALWPQAPQTLLSGKTTVVPAGAGWDANVQLNNAIEGPWNRQRLPLARLETQLVYVGENWRVQRLDAQLAGGQLQAQGQFNAGQWQGNVQIQGVDTAALDERLGAARLDGKLTARQTPAGIVFDADVAQASRGPTASKPTAAAGANTLDLAAGHGLRLQTVQAKGLWQAPMLTLEQLVVRTAEAQGEGQLKVDTTNRAVQGQLALTLPGVQVQFDGDISSSKGKGTVDLKISNTALAARWVSALMGAANAKGTPFLDQGSAELSGRWDGGWEQIGATLDLKSRIQSPAVQAQAHATASLKAPGHWAVRLDALQASAPIGTAGKPWTAKLQAPMLMELKQTNTLQTIETAGGELRLEGPSPGVVTVQVGATRWLQGQVSSATAAAPRSQWQSQGQVSGIPLAWLDALGQTRMANLGLRGDLQFGGAWEAKGGDGLSVRATLARSVGDLQLQPDGPLGTVISAGVQEASLVVTVEDEVVRTQLRWESARAGQLQAQASTRLARSGKGWAWPADAPLDGSVTVQLPPVGAWSLLAPPGWRLRGTLDGKAQLSGTRSDPKWRGEIGAQDLAVRSVVDGIDFSKGRLRATIDGLALSIEEFTIAGAGANGGSLDVKGSLHWLAPPASETTSGSDANLRRLEMAIVATATALRVNDRADRRLVVSGSLAAGLSEGKLHLRGNLKADQALFILPDDLAPQLGDDVRVRAPKERTDSTQASAQRGTSPVAQLQSDLIVTLNLGSDFNLRGRGLVTQLAGDLELRSTTNLLHPSLWGMIRTEQGTFQAYGQNLSIDRGELRFYGPFDNPSLDILAIRPNLQQRVGVQISGTALSPVVRLYADPELSDPEKLTWLVLGRSAASGGGESAMLQQAALALLGGKGRGLTSELAQTFGLDEVSVSGGASRTTGETGAAGASVQLGKRISKDFYVSYQRTLAGTMGTLSIFYDLSRRFTLRAQTGENSAVDLIFTLAYD